MTIRIGINGFGRIGRNMFRALNEDPAFSGIEVAAINDLTDNDTLAHLLTYDSVMGKFAKDVSSSTDGITVDGKAITVSSHKNPADINWGDLGVDYVAECTGIFRDADSAGAHLDGGAKKVIISAPAKGNVKTFVMGVNEDEYDPTSHHIVSNASCTTNCLAPVAKVLHEAVGIESGLMTTIHAYTNDQVLTDVFHKDLRRARSATMSQIPTKTGAAAAVGLVLPELNGRLDGFSMRVPTINVSVVDLCFVSGRPTTVEEVNAACKAAAEGPLKGVLGYNDLPLVSIDFNHNPNSSIFDAGLTRVSGNLVKVLSWYDNEWGFSNRMLDTTVALMNA
jgi:glyceraldehyde 3-phosphate dehydrogenase